MKKNIEFNNKLYTSALKFESIINISINQIDIDSFKYSFQASDQQWNHIGINSELKNSVDPSFKLFMSGKFLNDWWQLESNASPDSWNYFQTINNYKVQYNHPMPSILMINLANLVFAYANLFVNTYYLAPLREYPKRTYLWSGAHPQDVGKYGELTVAALLASRIKDPEVEVSVAKALKELDLIYSFRLKSITENRQDYEILVQKTPNSAEVLITDVGFGVSQVLPILVLCYYAPKGATLIFEQPEIHLHPSVQAGLADIFIEVIKTRNIQIIIESHSEHLLRRLQRRMAEEKDGFTNEDAALYFCKMDDQGDSELVPLEIDTYGNICNYPEGFFGDEMGDLVAMTEAAINRQMNVGA
jgi:hypothetical protein